MTKEPDEDLIEATIRRVAEAKAARLDGAQAADDVAEPAPPAAAPVESLPTADAAPNVDEDRIAETIRRVAEAKAARAAGERASDSVADAATVASPVESLPAVDAAPHADEDHIAETIRRVAQAKAARAADVRPIAATEPVPAPAPRPIGNPVPPLPRQPAPIAAREPRAADDGLADVVADLRRELAQTRRELRALSERFEASLARAAGPRAVPAAAEGADDEWDEAPQLPRVPLGQPPRPAIMRDPSPHTATAARLEPESETIIDTRPLPKPLPPLHAEPKRGLDLLPRTYRITVEDKRRGVDLVPLHRALLGMDGVRDMSLLSYSNGVAIVAVDTVDELEPQTLEGAITRAMSRAAKVEVHNDTTMVVKLAEE